MFEKEIYLQTMCKNLIPLRAAIGMTQEELARYAGVSRQTIVAAERENRLSWNTYLSLVFIFSQCAETKALLDFWDIFPKEFISLFEPTQPDLQKEVF